MVILLTRGVRFAVMAACICIVVNCRALHASFKLQLNVNGATLTIADNSALDVDVTIGSIITPSSFPFVGLSGYVQATSTPVTSGNVLHSAILLTNTLTSGSATITIAATDTDYPSPANGVFSLTSSTSGTITGNGSYSLTSFADPINVEFGAAITTGLQGVYTSSTFANTVIPVQFNATGGFSLTHVATLVLAQGATLNATQSNVTGAVAIPEPSAAIIWGVFGISLFVGRLNRDGFRRNFEILSRVVA